MGSALDRNLHPGSRRVYLITHAKNRLDILFYLFGQYYATEINASFSTVNFQSGRNSSLEFDYLIKRFHHTQFRLNSLRNWVSNRLCALQQEPSPEVKLIIFFVFCLNSCSFTGQYSFQNQVLSLFLRC